MKIWLQRLVASVSGAGPDWDALEAALIQADFGAKFAGDFVKRVEEASGWGTTDAIAAAREAIRSGLGATKMLALGRPVHVVLMVGVNGTGKTTSAAKLAGWHLARGRKVRLAAADTFRAAAGEQLEIWARRLGVPVTVGAPGSDPAAVAFRAVEEAKSEGQDVVIVDTAGRQHTRHNLMAELGKVARVIGKHGPDMPQEALLVVDANTGGNALAQAKEFSKAVRLTGLVASKLDGSGLGGAVFAIQRECGIPPLWSGTGERLEDFEQFNVDAYLDRLFSDV